MPYGSYGKTEDHDGTCSTQPHANKHTAKAIYKPSYFATISAAQPTYNSLAHTHEPPQCSLSETTRRKFQIHKTCVFHRSMNLRSTIGRLSREHSLAGAA